MDLCDNQCKVFGILFLFELFLARWHSGALYLGLLPLEYSIVQILLWLKTLLTKRILIIIIELNTFPFSGAPGIFSKLILLFEKQPFIQARSRDNF